jgi:hypothetical protein
MTEDDYREAQAQLERDRLELDRLRFKSENRATTRHFAAILGAGISIAGLAISGSQIYVAKVQKEQELELQARKAAEEQRASAEEANRKANLEAVRLIFDQREAIFSTDAVKRDAVVEQLELVLPTNISQRLFARLGKQAEANQAKAFAAAEQRVLARFISLQIPAASFNRARNVEVGGGLSQYGPDLLHNGPPYDAKENLAEYDIQVEAAGSYELWVQYASDDSRPVQISMNGLVINNTGLASVTKGWFTANLAWERQGTVSAIEGRNVLRLYRNNVFPHIRMIELRPILLAATAKASG